MTTNFTPGREQASGLAIQANGKLVAAGEARATRSRTFALARYKTDGTLDSTFSRNGKVLTDFTSKEDVALDVGIQANGRIVACGRANGIRVDGRVALARYRGGIASARRSSRLGGLDATVTNPAGAGGPVLS